MRAPDRTTSSSPHSPAQRRFAPLAPLALALALSATAASAQVDVTASAGNPGPVTYATLKLAFDAVNDGTHQGSIAMAITADTTETVPAVLNASGSGAAIYTSVTISPSGGAPRTISGAIAGGSPLIDLNGADNVTIDGLNTGGNTLTIANTTVSATSGTATIRFIGGATNNTITNSNIQGSGTTPVATNGATIFFSTDAVTTNGNDNNTISNNNIGPAGANLPTKAILGNGSTTTTAIGNSGIAITNNNIFDYFGAAVTSSGVATNGGCNTWTIANNRFYQTGTRTWTTGSLHVAIDIRPSTTTSGAQGFTITGNTIGFASDTQTGTYTLTGTGAGAKFIGILFNGISSGTTTNVNSNTVAGVSMTGVTASGTSTSSPFTAILFQEGNGVTNNNTVGSQSAAGSLTFSTTTTSATDVYGIYNFSSTAWTSNGNNLGGISVTNLGGSGTFLVYGMRAFTGSSTVWTASSNFVGGTVANSIQLAATGTGSQVVGMFTSNAPALLTSNTIRNLTTNIGTGTTTGASVIGISITASTPNHTLSRNTIFNLSNTHASAASVVTGIQFTGSTANTLDRNAIYGLNATTTSAAAEVNGIRVAGGTTVYRNNMIAVGAGIGNAIGTGSTTGGINGIFEAGGTNSFFHNSVYVGGAPSAGVGPSYAFASTQTTVTRSVRDNVFFNARSNAGATGKNYAIRVAGTTPNPAGLTLNNNLYFANGVGAVFGFFNALDVANLAAWKVAVGQDGASFESNPQYLDPTNATPDLHLHPTNPTVAEGNGADVGVVDDFDGQTRSGLTPVDIGADAGNFSGIDLAPPVIVYTPLGNTSSTASRTLSTAISDLTGVPTAGPGLPVVYYRRIASDPYVGNTCAFISGSAYDCVLDYTLVPGGSVSAGDVIQYYVAAQDTLGNVTANPSAGAGGFTANPPAAAIPPTTPASYRIAIPLSGSLSVGAGGGYASLTNAGGLFEAINNNVLTGDVTVDILSDLTLETGAVALNQWTEEGAGGYTMLIRPSGAPRIVSGTSVGATGLIALNGADRVTIDGSTSGGTDQSLTITNLNAGGVVIWIRSASASNGATNDTVKNCLISGSATTGTIAGVLTGSGVTLGNDAEAPNSNNTLQHNTITKVQNAAYLRGNATTPDLNWTVSGNTFGSSVAAEKLGFRGMLIGNAQGFAITDNSILGVSSSASSTSTMTGIQVALAINGGTIARNAIRDIKQNNTAGWGSAGIILGASSTAAGVYVVDNMIWDVASQGFNGVDLADNGWGLAVASGGGYNIYANSIHLTTNEVAAGSITAAVNILAAVTTPGAVDLRDNVLASSQTVGTRYGVYCAAPAAVFANVDYNDYFAQNVGFLGAAQATLGGWQTATGQDANSLAVDPLFVSATDLHLQATSPLLNAGVALAAVTVDFDGQARPPATPDIGADELVQADLSITKTDGVGSVLAGGSLTYTIVASNAGASNAPGATVADSFPADLSCSTTCIGAGGASCTAGPYSTDINDVVNLPAGGSVTFTSTCTVSGAATGTISNTAIVTAPVGVDDPVPANNSATDVDTVTAPTADLSITKTDGSATATPGTSVTYTIVASNAGPVAAASATVADTFPGVLTGCSTTCVGAGGGTCAAGPFGGNINDTPTLPAGGSVTYTSVCTLDPTATGSLANTATVASATGDPNPGDNSATDTDTITPQSDLSISKTDGVTSVAAGQNTTYIMVVSNAGPSAAPSATVTDNFPAACTSANWTCIGTGGGTCTASGTGNINDSAGLPVGASVIYAASCAVSPSASGTLDNTATVSIGAADPNLGNNSATDSDTITGPVIFADGFESGDFSQWSLTEPPVFQAFATLPVSPEATEIGFGYDFAAVPFGAELAASPIAIVADAIGRPLFRVEVRRSGANATLELTLDVVGSGAGVWVPVAEVGQRLRIEWSAANQGDAGYVGVWLDGRLALWVDGFTPAAAPNGVTLLRRPDAPMAQ